ncbi:MAG: LysM peptidoglycan-binding domain-containing protein [Anaerolineaceae bacterium]|nr:LysM peptidoglycan-binding domain-containing protein [Anaerolineaceae bacterium]
MSDADMNIYEVEERNPVVHEREVVVVERRPGTRGELVKFALLVVVLLATVVIIALLRPYIFNTLVPAVLGEGQPAAPLVSDETEAETIKPEVEEDEATAEPAESDAAVEEGTEEAGEAAEEEAPTEDAEVGAEPENPEDFPTAVPSRTHTVQAGENLTAIAQQYGVTVQAIVAANKLTNPDRVTVGTTLIIPESQ